MPGELTVTMEDAEPNVLARRLVVEAQISIAPTAVCRASDDPTDALIFTSDATHEASWTLSGLRAGARYRCTVTAAPFADQEIDIELPDVDLADIALDIAGEGLWTTAIFHRFDGRPDILGVLDELGRTRYAVVLPSEAQASSSGLFSEPVDGGLLAGGGMNQLPRIFDAAGELLWTAPPPVSGEGVHHDANLHDGRLLALTWSEDTDGSSTYSGFGVDEVERSSDTTTWYFSSAEAVDAGTLVPDPVHGSDPFHANAVRAEGDAVWVSLRNPSLLVRIDRATKQITHTLGEDGDFTLLDVDGLPLDPREWFRGQHDPSFSEDGATLLLYDNNWPPRDPDLPQTRLMELALDLDARQARVLWTWTEPDWFEAAMGGVERLNDATMLVTSAHCRNCPYALTDARGAIFRLDPGSGEVVWRLHIRDDAGSVYRARAVEPCALFPALEQCVAAR